MHIDLHGLSLQHGIVIVIDAADPEEIRLQEMAKFLQPGASPQR